MASSSNKISINSLLSGSSSRPQSSPRRASQSANTSPSHGLRTDFAQNDPPRPSGSALPPQFNEPGSAAATQGTYRGVKQRRNHAPLIQRAVTSPQQPYNRNQTPTLPHSAVVQAQQQNTSPTVSSGSTLGSSHTISSAHSTPSGDHRSHLGQQRPMMTPPAPPRRTSTEKMDFLAGTLTKPRTSVILSTDSVPDLASMQNPQQGTNLSSRNLRASLSHDHPRSPSM